MNQSIEDGGPAFPSAVLDEKTLTDRSTVGMSLRDYFAAKAMQGMCANSDFNDTQWDRIAKEAYLAADALLTARKGTH